MENMKWLDIAYCIYIYIYMLNLRPFDLLLFSIFWIHLSVKTNWIIFRWKCKLYNNISDSNGKIILVNEFIFEYANVSYECRSVWNTMNMHLCSCRLPERRVPECHFLYSRFLANHKKCFAVILRKCIVFTSKQEFLNIRISTG